MRILSLIVSLILGISSFSVLAADGIKIGFIDIPKILSESKFAQSARTALESELSKDKAKLEKEQQEIKDLQAAFKRDQSIMSKDKQNEKQKEIQARVTEFRKHVAQTQQSVKEKQALLVQKTIKPIQDISSKIAKEKGLTVVFDRTQSALVFIDEALNLSQEIIKRLDESTAKK